MLWYLLIPIATLLAVHLWVRRRERLDARPSPVPVRHHGQPPC
jgi:uncharacterized iron-regulated membrane protein